MEETLLICLIPIWANRKPRCFEILVLMAHDEPSCQWVWVQHETYYSTKTKRNVWSGLSTRVKGIYIIIISIITVKLVLYLDPDTSVCSYFSNELRYKEFCKNGAILHALWTKNWSQLVVTLPRLILNWKILCVHGLLKNVTKRSKELYAM